MREVSDASDTLSVCGLPTSWILKARGSEILASGEGTTARKVTV